VGLGVLQHIGLMLAAEEHRCAWCQAEGLRLPPPPRESHGICPRHRAAMLAEIKAQPKVKSPSQPQNYKS